MTTRAMAPAVPARKVRREEVKPAVLKGIQPRAVSIPVLPLQVGSMARAEVGERKIKRYVRIEICFLSGKDCFI